MTVEWRVRNNQRDTWRPAGKRRSLLSRIGIVFLPVLALSVFFRVPQPQAQVDPGTAMLMIQVAESGLSLLGKGPDLTFEAIKAQSAMIVAIHKRLDAIEGSLSTLLEQVADLPEQMRKALAADRDTVRKETVEGWVNVVDELMTELSEVTKAKQAGLVDQVRARLRDRIDFLRAERSALFSRSDFVLPVIVVALNVELHSLAVLPKIGDEKSRVMEQYDNRLARMLDPTREGSLVSMRKALEAQQAELSLAISKAITGVAAPLVDGYYRWFLHTLVADRWERRPTFSDHGPDCPKCPVMGWVEGLVPYDDHTEIWNLHVTKDYFSSEGAGPFKIEVKPTLEKKVGNGLPNSIRHRNSDSEFVKEYIEINLTKRLQPTVEIYDARAKAIAALLDLEQLAISARTLLLTWNKNDAEKLAAKAQRIDAANPENTVNASDQAQRLAKAAGRIRAMDAAQKQAWKEIEEANRRFNAAVDEARSMKWRSDIMFGLELLKFGLQVQELNRRLNFIGGVADSSDAKGGANKPVQETNNDKGGSGKPIKKPADPSEEIKLIQSELINASPEKKAEVIMKCLEYAANHPASNWKVLPDGDTRTESLLKLASVLLNSMGESYSDRLHQEYGDTLVQGATSLGSEVLDSMKKADANKLHPDADSSTRAIDSRVAILTDSRVAILKAVLMPTPMYDETFVDAPSHTEFRQKINDLVKPFAQRRLEGVMSKP